MKTNLKSPQLLGSLFIVLVAVLLGAANCEPPVEPEVGQGTALTVWVVDDLGAPVVDLPVYVADEMVQTDDEGVAHFEGVDPEWVWVGAGFDAQYGEWEGSLVPNTDQFMAIVIGETDPPVIVPPGSGKDQNTVAKKGPTAPEVKEEHPTDKLANDNVLNPRPVKLPWPPCPGDPSQ